LAINIFHYAVQTISGTFEIAFSVFSFQRTLGHIFNPRAQGSKLNAINTQTSLDFQLSTLNSHHLWWR